MSQVIEIGSEIGGRGTAKPLKYKWRWPWRFAVLPAINTPAGVLMLNEFEARCFGV